MSAVQQRVHMRTPNKTILLKVVILGDGGVGKSCLMNRFVSDNFEEQNFHTIGVEFLNKDLVLNGVNYTLQIWDTAGQERFKSLRTPFYRGSDICLLTYAIDDQSSFQNVKMWMDEFIIYADIKDGSEHFPFVVVGNKSDIPAREREVAIEQMAEWCSKNKVSTFIETSAKTATNVSEAFAMAVQRWLNLERLAEKEQHMMESTDSVILARNPAKQENVKSSCCGGGSY